MNETITKRHPIRGFLYGIVFGLGLMMLAVGQGWAALGTWPPFILFVVGLVVATLWGMYAPAKPPKGEPPPERVEVITSETSRFDQPGDDDDHGHEPIEVPAGDSGDSTPASGVDSGEAASDHG
jgi:hypothetical protein